MRFSTGTVVVNADESPLPPRSLVALPERPPSEIFPEAEKPESVLIVSAT